MEYSRLTRSVADSYTYRVRSLSIVLEDTEKAISKRDFSSEESARLVSILDGCKNTLTELQVTLDKYKELESKQKKTLSKTKRTWKRLKFEPEDIRELRDRVSDNISLLNIFATGMIGDDTAELLKHHRNKEEEAFLEWLTPTNSAAQQIDVFSRRTEGTGQWLLDSTQFKSWVETENKTLFCPGIPGAGKTVLTSVAVNALNTRFQADGNVAVIHMYCNYKQQEEQNVEDILASLLKQLIQRKFTLPEVRALRDKYIMKQPRPSASELLSTLQSVIANFSRVFIFVDALDECSSSCRTKLLNHLFELRARPRTSLFTTARFITEITVEFEQHLNLEIRASPQDIHTYVEGYINDLPRFVQRDASLQQEISTEIVRAIDGMYVYPSK